MNTAPAAPNKRDFDLVNEVLAICDAQEAYRVGIASAAAWHHKLHVTRKLLLDVIDCKGIPEACVVIAKWLQRRGAKVT